MHTLNLKHSCFKMRHSNTLSQAHSQSSNTLTQTPKSVTLNPSVCNKTHPHPQTLSSFLTISFRRSPHPYLQNPFCPYQRKFRFFQVWRYVFSFVCSFIEKWEMRNEFEWVYCYKFEYGFIIARKYLFSVCFFIHFVLFEYFVYYPQHNSC